jgi:hypothetical protein
MTIDTKRNKIIERYLDLASIKKPIVEEIRQANIKSNLEKEQIDHEHADYRTFISRGNAEQLSADISESLPVPDFIPMDEDARKNVIPFKHLWQYYWFVDETDAKIDRAIDEAVDV